MSRLSFGLSLMVVLAAGCSKCQPTTETKNDAAQVVMEERGSNTAIRSNYERDPNKAPDPRAVALCEALHTVPAVRRAECTKQGTGVIITPLCVDTLSAALESAKIKLDEPGIARCAAAMKAVTDDCSFVAKKQAPLPAECDPLITGTLAAGQICRSSLECAAGLQCFGSGPNDRGRCTPPAPAGISCGTAVDSLAAYARQISNETSRPACLNSYCRLNKCIPHHLDGAECNAHIQCASGLCGQDLKCVVKTSTATAP